MRVSIVIPCYNHARFVGEAVESALAQSHPDIEVIVVDDGSSDDSASVASRLGVRVVRQPNRGLSCARNAGLQASTGAVVIFLDADDRLKPGAAAAGVTALQRDPQAMLAFGRCLLIDEQGAPLPTAQPVVTTAFYEALLRSNYIWTPGMVAFRRSVFGIVGTFDPRVNPSADYDMYLRIARRFPFVPHGAVVAEYRQHGASMSRNAALMLTTTLRVLRRQWPHAIRSAVTRRAFRDGMRQWRHWYGDHLVQEFRRAIRTPRGRATALVCAWRLLRLHPAGVLTHLRKKAACVLQAGRAMPATEIASAISRASDSPGSL